MKKITAIHSANKTYMTRSLILIVCSLAFSSAYKLQADDVVRLYVLCYAMVCIVVNPCTLSAGVL